MNLSDLLLDSAAYLDLDATLPTSTELTTRIRFANMAVREWAHAYKWRQLKVESTPSLASFASLALSNYDFLDGPPLEYLSDNTYRAYNEVAPADRFYRGVSDQYSYVTGNEALGFALHLNGIAVNSTLTINYVRGPSTMATLTDVCEVPDPEFVTSRIISYVLESRNDERFPIVRANGSRLLQNMIGTEMIQLPGGTNTTPRKGVAAYKIGD